MILPARNPHHVIDRIVRQLRTQGRYLGEDPWEDALARGLSGDVDIPQELAEALSLYADVEHRSIIEALLLCGATENDVKECLGVELAVTKAYKHLIFDSSVFKTRLDSMRYVSNLEDGNHKHLAQRGMAEGLEFLKLKFGGGAYNVSALAMLQKQLNKAYEMMCAVEPANADADFAKEVRQWAAVSTKAVAQMPTALDVSNTENNGTLLFALETRKDALISSVLESEKPTDGASKILTGLEVDDV